MGGIDHQHPTDKEVYLILFGILFIFRYVRTSVSIFTWWTFKPKPVPKTPALCGADVTVVVPTTFKSPGDLVQCLTSIVLCQPAIVYVVTAHSNVDLVKTSCALSAFKDVRFLGVEKLNKRKQMLAALQEVETKITVFVDDDVFWPRNYLISLLAVFEDPKVGAGGTRQRGKRPDFINFWQFLGIAYLERRVWNNFATNAVDGSISTLSGRTAAYRTNILKTEEFFQYFQNDTWLKRKLNSDDDKCLTRYVFAHGWGIALQSDPSAVIETTVEDDCKYIHQCLRWARAHWRGNFTVMTKEKYWRSRKYWWGAYAIYVGQFQTPALLIDCVLLALLACGTAGLRSNIGNPLMPLILWILLSKTIKLWPHFVRHPRDLKFLPVSIIFGYLHGLINIYALFTLHHTHWGSQNLCEVSHAGAEGDDVICLLRQDQLQIEEYRESTPEKLTDGEDLLPADVRILEQVEVS